MVNTSLKGKTIFITGASRGIGQAIAVRCAKEGANVAVVAKTVTAHPKLPGTIFTAVEEINKAGGKGLAIECDIRDEKSIQAAIDKTVSQFGGIDIVINNASAIAPYPTLDTSVKQFDLMNQINVRGTWITSRLALPHLLKSFKAGRNPHILTLSPPLPYLTQSRSADSGYGSPMHGLEEGWFGAHAAYTTAKYGMSMVTLGLANEYAGQINVNALWPLTFIATAALAIAGSSESKGLRTDAIMADAAYLILTQHKNAPKQGSKGKKFATSDEIAHHVGFSGHFCVDELVLRQIGGMSDLSKYAKYPGTRDSEMVDDGFVDQGIWNEVRRMRRDAKL